jgi:DNA-binding NarL/FixJ family response regulator
MTKPIRILIADDHAMIAQALATLLSAAPDISVVDVVHRTEDAVTRADEQKPDVVLLDIDMPGLSCFEAARIIQARCASCAVVFVSAFTHDQYIQQALDIQARGYLCKSEPAESVAAAVRTVAAGGAYFSPDVQRRIIIDGRRSPRLGPKPRTRLSTLTRSELEILRYVARGMSHKQIGRVRGVKVKTVNAHVNNLMRKLSVHNRVELSRIAFREGLAEP